MASDGVGGDLSEQEDACYCMDANSDDIVTLATFSSKKRQRPDDGDEFGTIAERAIETLRKVFEDNNRGQHVNTFLDYGLDTVL